MLITFKLSVNVYGVRFVTMFKQYFFKFKQKMIDQNIKHRIEAKKIKSKNKIKLAKYQIQNWNKKIKSKNKIKLAKYQIQNWNIEKIKSKKKCNKINLSVTLWITCLFVYNTLRFFLSDKVCLFPASFAVALLVICLRCQLFWLQFWHKFHVWVGFSGVPSYWLICFDWQLSWTTTAPGSWNPVLCCWFQSAKTSSSSREQGRVPISVLPWVHLSIVHYPHSISTQSFRC